MLSGPSLERTPRPLVCACQQQPQTRSADGGRSSSGMFVRTYAPDDIVLDWAVIGDKIRIRVMLVYILVYLDRQTRDDFRSFYSRPWTDRRLYIMRVRVRRSSFILDRGLRLFLLCY